jgi:sugar lactone lactonase YvrE
MSATVTTVFDARVCTLGEGPLWHPLREQLFWFDILGNRLLSQGPNGPEAWAFDENVSAASWVDEDRLLIASESGLDLFDLNTTNRERLVTLEADNPVTRSNDGRADPWGGFWIGTMGKHAEPGAGAIYRYYQGQLERLFDGITVSNAICFTPDRSFACYTDTPTRQIIRQPLDDDGWPTGAPEVFVDLTDEGLYPDGAVFDAAGCLWNAQWGASRCARYDPAGRFLGAIDFGARQTSCPAFGGADFRTLYMTSAAVGLKAPGPTEGQTFATVPDIDGQNITGPDATGLAEYQVIL